MPCLLHKQFEAVLISIWALFCHMLSCDLGQGARLPGASAFPPETWGDARPVSRRAWDDVAENARVPCLWEVLVSLPLCREHGLLTVVRTAVQLAALEPCRELHPLLCLHGRSSHGLATTITHQDDCSGLIKESFCLSFHPPPDWSPCCLKVIFLKWRWDPALLATSHLVNVV